MSTPRFTPEFKKEAVKQVTERGYPVSEVASRLGVSTHSLYQWLKRYDPKRIQPAAATDQHAEISSSQGRTGTGNGGARHPKKRPPHTLLRSPGKVCLHPGSHAVVSYPEIVSGHVSASQWLLRLDRLSTLRPGAGKQRLLGYVKQAWLESGGAYGCRKAHDDLRAQGERCGKHRVA